MNVDVVVAKIASFNLDCYRNFDDPFGPQLQMDVNFKYEWEEDSMFIICVVKKESEMVVVKCNYDLTKN